MAMLEKRKLERVQYWQGQMLRARDFRDLQAVEAQRRWWHNRALHNAYGVAEGLTCCSPNAQISKSTGLFVNPGVAYDISGRELILERRYFVAIPTDLFPSQTSTVSLLIRYKSPARRLRPDEIAEVCFTAPGSVVAGTAEFVWKAGYPVDPSEGVTIIAVQLSKGLLLGRDPSFIQPPAPVPVARPLLASGTTVPGSTPWNLWYALLEIGPNSDLPPNLVGVETWVDTSAAGFQSVPCYFASLEGPLWNPQTRKLAPAILQSIGDEAVTGFTFRVWLQLAAPPVSVIEVLRTAVAPDLRFSFVNNPNQFLLFAQQQKLFVSWIGCQMRSSTASCCGQESSTAVSGAKASTTIPAC
jgi:hypothetical protein